MLLFGIILIALAAIMILGGFIWLNRQSRLSHSQLKESFSALSFEALSKSMDQFLKIANETLSKQTEGGERELEAKKKLIDQTLGSMKEELQKVQCLVTNFEKDRELKFGELSGQLKLSAEQLGKLHDTTNQLKAALVSTKARGQWGQRIADDILRLAGFAEGINYQKDKSQDTVTTRPDYTFFLPQGLKVNMDVKFPMNSYLRYLETESDSDKQKHKDQFLRDVRARMKEVTNRDYINPEEKTVDYVILFIPNEQLYSFINENDRALIDDALRNKVIFCSPLTLYAILAVIHHAIDNFNLEKTAAHMLSLLGAFNKQWELFAKSFDDLGEKIGAVQKEFDNLTTTRRKQLDRQVKKIEDLRKQEGIAESAALPEEQDLNIPSAL
ncbi:MAG: DNA recombination protein RmuC [Candidatus Omnitrophota bacterium]|nr:DNA recombination protein RmuC [Candidatus Omnitrophota bacterium]